MVMVIGQPSHSSSDQVILASVARFNMRSLTNVLDEELKLYLLSMLQMQEETQHAGQMVMQDEVANVSDKVKHKTGCELMELFFLLVL